MKKIEAVIRTAKFEEGHCLFQTAYTGKVGDGTIFVFDIVDSYRIRTKEKGEKAL